MVSHLDIEAIRGLKTLNSKKAMLAEDREPLFDALVDEVVRLRHELSSEKSVVQDLEHQLSVEEHHASDEPCAVCTHLQLELLDTTLEAAEDQIEAVLALVETHQAASGASAKVLSPAMVREALARTSPAATASDFYSDVAARFKSRRTPS